jgi:hypothetical protein
MSDANDLGPHLEMWHSFLRIIGYSVAAIVVILVCLALAFL